MSYNNTLQRTVNYAQQVIRQAPLTGVGGVANEPAFSIGDWVRQFILNAPFAWRWNRVQNVFTVIQGTQDYIQPVSNLGFLEVGSIANGTNQWQLQVSNDLGQTIQQARPTTITPLTDDGTNVTFRLIPVPDQTYTVNVNYQGAAPNFVNLTDTWAPIPDYLYYLVESGFLAKTYEYINDEKFPQSMSLFVKQVVAANAGIADTQSNIYASEFINSAREQQAQLGNSASGRAGRGLFNG